MELVTTVDETRRRSHYYSTMTPEISGVFPRAEKLKVHHKQAAGFLVGIFAVLGILGALFAIAIPHANEMVYDSKAAERETSLLRIQNAVTEMLRQSPGGTLESIGPITDLDRVRTADDEPLVLTDYLTGNVKSYLAEGCKYSFTADGTVIQFTN